MFSFLSIKVLLGKDNFGKEKLTENQYNYNYILYTHVAKSCRHMNAWSFFSHFSYTSTSTTNWFEFHSTAVV